jgi:prevent-host-death family protein
MKMSATEFKARSLALIDLVHEKGEVITITKRGRVVAKLVAEVDAGERPWLALRDRPVRWRGDPFASAVSLKDVKALR